MVILKLLRYDAASKGNSEEIFDFSAEQMTMSKATNLKNQMCGEFSQVFQLCHEVLDKAQKPRYFLKENLKISLISATLETCLRFLNWIPLGYIFETNLIDILHSRVSIVKLKLVFSSSAV